MEMEYWTSLFIDFSSIIVSILHDKESFLGEEKELSEEEKKKPRGKNSIFALLKHPSDMQKRLWERFSRSPQWRENGS